MRYPIMVLAAAGMLAGCSRAPGPAAEPGAGGRIVSLAPNLTEILFAVGAGGQVVGRTSACDYPPDAKAVPVVGGFGEPSLEMLLAARPTLVLDVDLADEMTAARLKELGLRRERVPCGRLDEIPSAIAAVGTLTGREAQARQLAEKIEARLTELRLAALEAKLAGTRRPRVYVEIWSDPLTTVGHGSFVSELVGLAGGTNIGDEVGQPYFQASPEWVLARDPEVIVCLYMSPQGQPHDMVAKRPGWDTVSAVIDRRIYDGLDNDVLLRPGPRALEGIDRLAACISATGGP